MMFDGTGERSTVDDDCFTNDTFPVDPTSTHDWDLADSLQLALGLLTLSYPLQSPREPASDSRYPQEHQQSDEDGDDGSRRRGDTSQIDSLVQHRIADVCRGAGVEQGEGDAGSDR